MDKSDPPKKARNKFLLGNKSSEGRRMGSYNKDKLVRENISEKDYGVIMAILADKAKSGDLGAAKIVIDLLPDKRFISHPSIRKIKTEEQVAKAMEDTGTLVGNEELSLEDALVVTTIIGKIGETILTAQSKQINASLELEKISES